MALDIEMTQGRVDAHCSSWYYGEYGQTYQPGQVGMEPFGRKRGAFDICTYP
ncbi:MAG: hypothetical protein ACLTE2_07250 [Eubacteriales bacterium]